MSIASISVRSVWRREVELTSERAEEGFRPRFWREVERKLMSSLVRHSSDSESVADVEESAVVCLNSDSEAVVDGRESVRVVVCNSESERR